MCSRLPIEEDPVLAEKMYNSVTDAHADVAIRRSGLDQGTTEANVALFREHICNPLDAVKKDTYETPESCEGTGDSGHHTTEDPDPVVRLARSKVFSAETRKQKLQLLMRGAIIDTDSPSEGLKVAELVDQISLQLKTNEYQPKLSASSNLGEDSEPEFESNRTVRLCAGSTQHTSLQELSSETVELPSQTQSG
jgi:hypothetical protein